MTNLKPKVTPTDYESAERAHEKYGDTTLCYATTFAKEASAYVIRHHGTAIVTYHPDGTIYLFGNGWASQTTADRMHRFTPSNVAVWCRKGTLGVEVDGTRVGSAKYGLTVYHA